MFHRLPAPRALLCILLRKAALSAHEYVQEKGQRQLVVDPKAAAAAARPPQPIEQQQEQLVPAVVLLPTPRTLCILRC